MTWGRALAAVVLLSGIAHIATVLLLPAAANRQVVDRLPSSEANRVELLPPPSPDGAALPLMDPAFAHAICRFDLREGPVTLRMPASQNYASATFYSPRGRVFFVTNDRGGRPVLEVSIMTTAQHDSERRDDDSAPAERLIAESPSVSGLVVLRAFAPEPSAMLNARGALAEARCERAGS